MSKIVYTVHAYRWGDRERHSYSVGVYSKKHAALKAADIPKPLVDCQRELLKLKRAINEKRG